MERTQEVQAAIYFQGNEVKRFTSSSSMQMDAPQTTDTQEGLLATLISDLSHIRHQANEYLSELVAQEKKSEDNNQGGVKRKRKDVSNGDQEGGQQPEDDEDDEEEDEED